MHSSRESGGDESNFPIQISAKLNLIEDIIACSNTLSSESNLQKPQDSKLLEEYMELVYQFHLQSDETQRLIVKSKLTEKLILIIRSTTTLWPTDSIAAVTNKVKDQLTRAADAEKIDAKVFLSPAYNCFEYDLWEFIKNSIRFGATEMHINVEIFSEKIKINIVDNGDGLKKEDFEDNFKKRLHYKSNHAKYEDAGIVFLDSDEENETKSEETTLSPTKITQNESKREGTTLSAVKIAQQECNFKIQNKELIDFLRDIVGESEEKFVSGFGESKGNVGGRGLGFVMIGRNLKANEGNLCLINKGIKGERGATVILESPFTTKVVFRSDVLKNSSTADKLSPPRLGNIVGNGLARVREKSREALQHQYAEEEVPSLTTTNDDSYRSPFEKKEEKQELTLRPKRFLIDIGTNPYLTQDGEDQQHNENSDLDSLSNYSPSPSPSPQDISADSRRHSLSPSISLADLGLLQLQSNSQSVPPPKRFLINTGFNPYLTQDDKDQQNNENSNIDSLSNNSPSPSPSPQDTSATSSRRSSSPFISHIESGLGSANDSHSRFHRLQSRSQNGPRYRRFLTDLGLNPYLPQDGKKKQYNETPSFDSSSSCHSSPSPSPQNTPSTSSRRSSNPSIFRRGSSKNLNLLFPLSLGDNSAINDTNFDLHPFQSNSQRTNMGNDNRQQYNENANSDSPRSTYSTSPLSSPQNTSSPSGSINSIFSHSLDFGSANDDNAELSLLQSKRQHRPSSGKRKTPPENNVDSPNVPPKGATRSPTSQR